MWAGAKPLPQPSRGNDLQWGIGDGQQPSVVRHEHVGTPRRRRILPFAEARGYLTDDDVFRDVS